MLKAGGSPTLAELSRLLGTTGHPSSEAGDDAVAQG